MRLHVRTPRRNKSIYDPYTNLLRVTTEALSAVHRRMRSLTVEPFGFDAHLALNVQRILKEEAHLDAVADPAGGSYYIESLTDALARRGLEAVPAGGGRRRLCQGAGLRLPSKRRWRRPARRARRPFPRGGALVGVNNYPDVAEKTPEFEVPAPETAGPLPQVRLAEPFEKIRERTSGMRTRPAAIPRCCC